MALAKNTMKDRIFEMTTNISHQQTIGINSFGLLSLCFDESTKITESVRLGIFIHYPIEYNIKEKMIILKSLETATKGIDIYLQDSCKCTC